MTQTIYKNYSLEYILKLVYRNIIVFMMSLRLNQAMVANKMTANIVSSFPSVWGW